MSRALAANSTNVRASSRMRHADGPQPAALPLPIRLLRGGMAALQLVAPPLAADAAEVVFRTPRRHAAPPRERAWTASAWHLRFGRGEERIHAWAWGYGPPVLLVHGWEGRGSQMGALALAVAGRGFRAIAIDAPAHGDSAGRLSSLPQLAAAIARVAYEVGPVRAIVAHSFGAAGTAWAIASGLDVPRLALLAPGADMHDYVERLGEQLGASQRTLDGMVRRIERRFAVDWQVARRPALAGAARAPETPVLVVHDRDDDEIPWRDGERVAAAWPRGELHLTQGLGHRRVLRDDAVAAAVADFVAR